MKIKRQSSNFTMVSNVLLRDKNMSLKAKGLYAVLFSFPDDWDFSIRGLAAIMKEGHDSIRAGINELEERGYLLREMIRNDDGKFARGADYILYNEPTNITEIEECSPVSGNPTSVKSASENPTQYNIIDINKDNNNKSIQRTSELNSMWTTFKHKKEFTEACSYFPEHLLPTTDSAKFDWLDNFDKLIRIDNFNANEIVTIIKVAREDDFWSKNLLSMCALRRKNKDGVYKIVSIRERLKDIINQNKNKTHVVPEGF